MKRTRAQLATLALIFVAGSVHAETDTFGAGNGQSGSLIVPNGTATTINTCWALQGGAASGTSSVVVAGSGQLASGALVMIHQTTGVPDPLVPDASVLDYSGSNVGRWELARVANHAGTSLTLTAPLVGTFGSIGAQVISVPEYTTVTVEPFATVAAPPWDGGCGGVVAFLASSTATNDGTISADHAGFRGGPTPVLDITSGCTAPDLSPPAAGPKGEGLVPGQFGPATGGWRAVTSGGGGGDCKNAGGGGGGNGGMGGSGGHTNASDDGARLVGGHGGASILVANGADQLLFGGGGGAGHTDEGQDARGESGGGAILIRAQALVGVGQFTSNGQSAPPTGLYCVGAGGGGAGGTIALLSASALACSKVEALGGAGGGTINCGGTGPGGGGAGGRVFLTGTSIACAATVEGGVAGYTKDGGHDAAEPSLAQLAAGAGRGVLAQVIVPGDGGSCAGADAGCGLQVGCDCASAGGVGWWVLGLSVGAGLVMRARRNRPMNRALR